MLTLLRKIRRSLINSGKARSYLLYAIGEITLVVIGILIALQINNWNEDRKIDKVRNDYIQNMLEDLISDTLNINKLIEYSDKGTMQIGQYFAFFEASDINVPSEQFLDSARNASHCCTRYFPINSTYLEMLSTGNLKLLKEEQRDAMIKLNNMQEFYQILMEKNVSGWLARWQEFKNVHPVTEKGKIYFHKRGVFTQHDMDMALFHFHQVLNSELDVLRGLKFRGLEVKEQTKATIELLQQK